jgi:hypothetical protein
MEDIIIQGIGIIGMIMNILSFQMKTQRGILYFQLVGGALFSVHFILLGAVVGGILNVAAVFRAIVYANREKLHAQHSLWVALFVAVFIGAYVANFTLLGAAPTPKNFILELLPVIGMTASTVGMKMGTAKSTRMLSLINSPCWLTYNCFNVSIGGIICEVFCLASIAIGIYRYDTKGKKND